MLLSIFTTILLTVSHLHSTLASPVVTEGGIAADQSPNLPRSLAKRYVPLDQQCKYAVHWISRTCNPAFGDQFWIDSCGAYGYPAGEIRSTVHGFCTNNRMCSPTIRENKHTIECLPRPGRPVVVANAGASSQQSGVTVVGDRVHNNRQYTVSVKLATAIKLATVSAILEGTDGTYVVAARRAIVASLRGTSSKACNYNAAKRECVPTGRFNLALGSFIDFTFGLATGQAVNFYYTINGGS
jgi:hypothetical protein